MNLDYVQLKEKKITGRYITNKHIEPLLNNLSNLFNVETIGKSVLEKPIYSVRYGCGKIKIFMWSQMHGNESTTTKALFDFFNFLESDTDEVKNIKINCTLLFIPILNPDGATLYTRENANEIDLNRDAIDLSQPESKILRQLFTDFDPDFCFNLHDQRTIYAVGNSSYPASVSFLAPAYNEARDFNESRTKAISIITAINIEMQKYIPNQVGRFDDTYNRNCVGDTFQLLNVPTILFEAGHFQNDYQREETRKYIYIALKVAVNTILKNSYENDVIKHYLSIPQNKVHFNDFIYRNVRFICNSLNIITTFALDYLECLENDKIVFKAYFSEISQMLENIGHVDVDVKQVIYSDYLNKIPEVGQLADFSLNNTVVFENGIFRLYENKF